MCIFQLFLCVISVRQVTFFAYKHLFSYCQERREPEKTENSPLTLDIATPIFVYSALNLILWSLW